MRILAVSDRVEPDLLDPEKHGEKNRPDLIISCGDLPPEYLTTLRQRYGVSLFYVRGNHDIRYEQSPPAGCLHLDERVLTHGGMRIFGLSGSRWYNGGANQYTESDMRRKIRRSRLNLWRRRGVDLLVAHAPPRYVKDAEDPCHQGFVCFHDFLKRYRPQVMLHGHIHRSFNHPSERVSRAHETQVVNCYGHYLLDIDER